MGKETLDQLVQRKKEVEDIIEEEAGELSKELEALWEDSNTSLSEKVDKYGYRLEMLEHMQTVLDEQIDKKKRVKETLSRDIQYLKTKLYNAANELKVEVLTGKDYEFKPVVNYTSIVDQDKVEDKYKNYNVEKLTKEELEFLILTIAETENMEEFHPEIKGEIFGNILDKLRNSKPNKIGVTLLPKEHLAIKKELSPTVKMKRI